MKKSKSKKQKFRKGTRVKLLSKKDLTGWSFSNKLKIGKIYTVRQITHRGSLLLEGIMIGENIITGEEQGFLPKPGRFRVTKY